MNLTGPSRPPIHSSRWLALIIFALALAAGLLPSAAQTNAEFQISGIVTLPADGCRQAIVLLCDSDSGQPLCRANVQPFMSCFTNEAIAMDWLWTTPDAAGHFEFADLPARKYIVVAQAWDGPVSPTNLFPLYQSRTARAETIHLLGRAEVVVPSAAARALNLSAPGTHAISFDQEFGNDDGLLLLGTQPQRGDPVLAWNGWGTNFIRHLIGFNLMPHGRTTVHGLPAEAHAAIFMNDNSPGFGTTRLHFGQTNPVKMPIVAGWSDGYKIPPTNLVWLVECLQTNPLKIDALLGITNAPTNRSSFLEREQFMSALITSQWNQVVVLPTGQKTTVAELLTALGYARLSGKLK